LFFRGLLEESEVYKKGGKKIQLEKIIKKTCHLGVLSEREREREREKAFKV